MKLDPMLGLMTALAVCACGGSAPLQPVENRAAGSVDAGIACFVMPKEPPRAGADGWNPLLAGWPRCFATVAGCTAARDELATRPPCEPIATPHWHCRAPPSATADSLAGIAMCFPSETLCESPCRPIEVAWCAANPDELSCYASETDCTQAQAFAADVLGATQRRCRRQP